jgi:hypothetical protein
VEPATLEDLIEMSGDQTERLRRAEWMWRKAGARKPCVLAMDLATHGGWASIDREGRFNSGTLRAGPGPTITEAWADQVHELLFGVDHLDLVVVEDVFVSPGFAGGGATACARLGGGAITIASVLTLPVVRVMASTWQPKMLGKREKDPATGRTRKHGKERSVALARALFGNQIEDDNEADAALLCRWAWGEP